MKKEYLKKLGLENGVIDKIIAEHKRASGEAAIEALTSAAGAKAPEVLRMLIGNTDPEGAKQQIAQLKEDYPWLFKGECPIFSAPADGEENSSDPFRYGAGL